VNPTAPTLAREQDDSFLRRFLAGEPAAARTVTRWARQTAHFRGYGLSREEREDAVQDAIAQLWTQALRPDFEIRRGLRAMLRTIVAARCIDRLRRRRRAAPLDESIRDPAPDAVERLAARDEGARLRRALLELDEPCREIVRLRFFEELDYATIAEREGRSESTLRVRLFHCIRALRSRLLRAAP